MRTTYMDKLKVYILPDRNTMGKKAAEDAGATIKKLLKEKEYINIIFAAAPSQSSFLAALIKDESIEWQRINAFHMDEYLDLAADAPQGFGNFLRREIFDHVQLKHAWYINGNAVDIHSEIERYTHLIKSNLPDIVFMGIGENTHLAFNEPYQADFNDAATIKTVTLDAVCRQQQVNDGCFKTLNAVPSKALTLTIPVLMNAPNIFCMVPGKNKAKAVAETSSMPVSAAHPSTILRTHANAVMYLDEESAALL